MKTTVFKATVTVAVLAAGVCSFTTMPTGRTLNEQEKMAFRGLDGDYLSCRECIGGGLSCANPGTSRVGRVCYKPPGTVIPTCDGIPGLIPSPLKSKFLDVWEHGERECEADILRCEIVPGSDPVITKWVWVTSGPDAASCLTLSYCEHTGTLSPKICNPSPPGTE